MHGDHDDRGVVLKAFFAVLAYGLHQTALDFFGRARAVTHYDVDRAQCAQAVEAVAAVVREGVAASMATAKTS